jgi:glyoxylase-like metal-dependent hydrolase (beta-lactamase superfamily II)
MVPATVKLRIFQSGYCLANSRIVNPRARRETVRFYATWLLLQHSTHGNILFDTGYTRRFFQATAHLPYKLYALATPVFVIESESARSQLATIGLSPEDISTIVISHFHADHIGGLLDFPHSQLVCSQKALDEATRKKGWAALRKGILPDLLPANLLQRTTAVESLGISYTEPQSGLVMYDWLGDGSLQLVELPGHARGMLGIRVRHEAGVTFFASDAFWNIHTFQQKILPQKIVTLFFDSWTDYVATFEKLHRYQEVFPDDKILFTHCPETLPQ